MCKHEGWKRLYIVEDKTKCDKCYQEPSKYDASLHTVLHQDGTTKVTKGKAWEIDHRTISKDDGKTVINAVTGKPAQY